MLGARVPSPLLLGVELPPVPVDVVNPSVESAPRGAPRALSAPAEPRPTSSVAEPGPWWEAARAAAEAGAGVVWFGGATGLTSPVCDACTLAAAAVDHVRGVHLGVVAAVPLGRQPGVLAREVTALDIVSYGRAAVRLQWATSGRPLGLVEASEALAEAVAVCSAVLRDEHPLFEGRHFHVAGAVNRPPPVQPGGPPVFAEVPSGPAAFAGAREVSGMGALHLMLRSATAVVCTDAAADVVAWKTAIEESAALRQSVGGDLRPPALVCRTTIGATARRAARTTAAATGLGIGERLRAARDAGADGVIVRIPPSRRVDSARSGAPATKGAGPPAANELAPVLAEYFAPWVR